MTSTGKNMEKEHHLLSFSGNGQSLDVEVIEKSLWKFHTHKK